MQPNWARLCRFWCVQFCIDNVELGCNGVRPDTEVIWQVDMDSMSHIFSSLVHFLQLEEAYNIIVLNPKHDLTRQKYGYRYIALVNWKYHSVDSITAAMLVEADLQRNWIHICRRLRIIIDSCKIWIYLKCLGAFYHFARLGLNLDLTYGVLVKRSFHCWH